MPHAVTNPTQALTLPPRLPSIYLAITRPLHLPGCLFGFLSSLKAIRTTTDPCIHPSIHASLHSAIHPSACTSQYLVPAHISLFPHTSVLCPYSHTLPAACVSTHNPIGLSVCSDISPSILSPSVHTCIHPCVRLPHLSVPHSCYFLRTTLLGLTSGPP